MLNNFIGGGQIFLHKVRMFGQVFFRNLNVSIIVGIALALLFNWGNLARLDWDGFISYRKAFFAVGFEDSIGSLREVLGNKGEHKEYIIAKSSTRNFGEIEASRLLKMRLFKKADKKALDLFASILMLTTKIFAFVFISIYIWWSKFGAGLKSELKKEGSDQVLSAREIKRKLRKLQMAGDITIGDMPIVKNSETRHFMISGSTGSGKTNLFHNILPQVEQKQHSAIVIDQTGEMIAKYYNPERGDIIFNPFDKRGAMWDFWTDCETKEDLETFSSLLFGFNRRSTGMNNDPFWERSAEVIFNSCAMQLQDERNFSVEELVRLVTTSTRSSLRTRIAGKEGAIYLGEDNRTTASSILSVLATLSKPMKYLRDIPKDKSNVEDDIDISKSSKTKSPKKSFSMKEYFTGVKEGKEAWLFLATRPSARDLTLPIIACLTDLAFTRLLDIGIDEERRIWFVFDELASLKKMPALSNLMNEGRKYGACILAGLQSLNQLYEYYGRNTGSSIFGQFGTNFFFRNNEPEVGRLVSSMCGMETVLKHQKNTSFGANEFRDGVSYNEQERRRNLVEYSDLANLKVKECFVLLPEPEVRVGRIEVPSAKLQNKNEGFCTRSDDANISQSKQISSTSNSDNRDKNAWTSGASANSIPAHSSGIGGILSMSEEFEREVGDSKADISKEDELVRG